MSLLDAAPEENNEQANEQENQSADQAQDQSQEQNKAESVDHNAEPSDANQQPWYFDENVAGDGERPEWLQEKYKSVAEQAKAYNEAQKRLGAFKGAPDEYDLTLEDMPDVKLEKDDPILDDFLKEAKENNVSQDYVTKMLNTYVKAIKMNNPDPKKELEKLGPNGKQDIQTLGKWAKNHLSNDEVDVFKKMINTADSVRVLQKLRGIMNQPITQPTKTNAPQVSKESILKKIHDPRYETDETFRNQVREELAQFG